LLHIPSADGAVDCVAPERLSESAILLLLWLVRPGHNYAPATTAPKHLRSASVLPAKQVEHSLVSL